jgi:hypothetical protein
MEHPLFPGCLASLTPVIASGSNYGQRPPGSAARSVHSGLTTADVYALLRQNRVDDLDQVGYLLYETRGVTTLIGADGEPGPLMRDALLAAGCRDVAEPVERHVRQQRAAS